MIHVALKLRSDVLVQPVHQGLNVCTEDAIACESLYIFLRLMLGGQSLFENELSDDDDKEEDDFMNDGDDDDHEVRDDEGNDHGTDDDLGSNDTADEEGKQPIRQQQYTV